MIHRIAFLCLRRGVSGSPPALVRLADFSLPTQRCFRCGAQSSAKGLLFSAYAEVFLTGRSILSSKLSFLCLRRGVSHPGVIQDAVQRLFSAYAEVFPPITIDQFEATNFSLPTQRCFRTTTTYKTNAFLFSAYAEVFLSYG